MAAVNCPLCVLRFASRNERDWHVRNEHEHLHVHPPADSPSIWWRRPHSGEQEDGAPPDEGSPD
jgi:hypothetical protein